MTRASLFLVLFAFTSLALVASNDCVRNIDGYTFNLCPFQTPIPVPFNLGNAGSGTITFAIAKPFSFPSYDRAYSVYLSGVGRDNGNKFASFSPVFKLTQKSLGSTTVPGVLIVYPLVDGNRMIVALKLLCDKNAPRDARLNIVYDGFIEDTVYFTASSYYGCPVNGPAGFLQA